MYSYYSKSNFIKYRQNPKHLKVALKRMKRLYKIKKEKEIEKNNSDLIRDLMIFFVYRKYKVTYSEVAELFGYSNHSSIIYAIKRIETQIQRINNKLNRPISLKNRELIYYYNNFNKIINELNG